MSTESYHIPKEIRDHVDYVTPGTRLRSRQQAAQNKKMRKRSAFKNDVKPFITKLPSFPHPNSTTCSTYVTADCTRGKPIALPQRSI